MKAGVFKRYWKVYKIFFANSISYISQFKTESFIRIFLNFAWVLSLFLTIEIIFNQTQKLGGWQKSEVYVLMLFWIIADEVWGFFVGVNLTNLSQLIRTGELDFHLTKPINSLFVISTKFIQIRSILRFFIEIILLIIIVIKFNIPITTWGAILAALLLIGAMIILYAFEILVNSLSFWLIKIDALYDLYATFFQFGRFPLEVFPKTLKIIFLTTIPIAFSAYVPTAALFGKWPWYGTLYVFAFAALSLFCALKFWNFALKKYSSASS